MEKKNFSIEKKNSPGSGNWESTPTAAWEAPGIEPKEVWEGSGIEPKAVWECGNRAKSGMGGWEAGWRKFFSY
jgi:hypothetical protein